MITGVRAAAIASALACALAAVPAAAQAWLPGRGEASLSITYSYFDGNDHLFSTDRIDGVTTVGYTAEGTHWYLGDTQAHTWTSSAEYAWADRWATTVSLGFVNSRYVGNDPVNLDLDDGAWHTSLEDARIVTRYALAEEPFAVAALLGLSIPTHDYATSGHSAPGDGLAELQAGAALGRVWPDLGNGLFASLAATYGVTEDAGTGRLNRLRAEFTSGYFVFPGVDFRLIGTFLDTFGGEDWVSDDPTVPVEHGSGAVTLDAAGSAARAIRLGGGVGFPIAGALTGSAAIITTVWGENLDDADFLVAGLTWGLRRGPSRAIDEP